jgi:hypothetical protein
LDVTAEDFRRHYESLSDEALLDIYTGELTELARSCHAEELERRGIDTGISQEDAADPAAEAAIAEEMICIVEYDFADEADLARGLLEAAEIPAAVENEPGVSRLMVPKKFGEQALLMLTTPLSDEELAAQAEAAGNPDDDE